MGFLGFGSRNRAVVIDGKFYAPFKLDGRTVDYKYARSLYGNSASDTATPTLPFGSWCVKPFIDTYNSYVGIPEAKIDNEVAAKALADFRRNNASAITDTKRAAMNDGKTFIRLSFEETPFGNQLIARAIPRDMVKNIVPDANGDILEIKLEYELTWKTSDETDKQCTVTEIITKDSIKTTYRGAIPEWVEGADVNGTVEETNEFGVIPIIRFFNGKEPWMSDGRAEITAVVPFIEAYNEIVFALLTSVKNNATPKPVFHVSNILDFIKYTFRIAPEKLQTGEAKLDLSQVGAIFTTDKDDKASYLQANSIAADMVKTLELLYYCIIDLTMPEYLYGTNMATSNASVKEQSPVWARKVTGKRDEWDSAFRKLYYTALAMLGQAKSMNLSGGLELVWPEATEKDENAFVTRLSTMATALTALIDRKVISPDSAFEAVKEYLPGLKDYAGQGGEGEKAIRFAVVTERINKIAQRLGEGDIDQLDETTIKSLLADLNIAA
jgi:hypothetical protein